MKWSRFVHAFPSVGILWHAIKLEKIKVNSEVLRSFSPGSSISSDGLDAEVYSELIAKGFLIDDSESIEKCLNDILEISENQRNIQAFYLILSTACNLKCVYCLYNSSESGSLSGKGEYMSNEVAIKAINLFCRETANNDRTSPDYWEQITFYGGEPLLNYQCLKTAVNYIRRLQEEEKIWNGVNFVINTNGTVLPEGFLNFAIAEKIEIQVSIDGPKQVHDSLRFFRTGTGSFDSVIASMEKMKKAGAEFTPLITITDANMDLLPDFIRWLCDKFSVKRYGLNLLMHTGGVIDYSYGKRAAQSMRKIHSITSLFGAVDKMYDRIFETFSSGIVSSQSCGAGKKLVVFPNGAIHTCQALEKSSVTAIGRLPSFELEPANRILWGARNRFTNTTCLACPAIGGCGGGCGASAYNAEGDVHGIDPNHCEWMKTVFNLWLEKLYY